MVDGSMFPPSIPWVFKYSNADSNASTTAMISSSKKIKFYFLLSLIISFRDTSK